MSTRRKMNERLPGRPASPLRAALIAAAGMAALAVPQLRAEDAPPPDPAAHTVIVPYDEGKAAHAAKAERYYLDYSEFQRLWNLAKENRRPESAEKEEGKPEAAITSALYDAEIQDDRFVIHACLSVVTRGGSWVKLPLALKAEGLSISDVKLDGNIAVLNNNELAIEHAGAHQVDLTAQVLMARGWKDLKLELPRAVAALMAVTASGRDGKPQFSNKSWLVVDEQRQGKRTFTLPLGSEMTFGLTREPFRKEVADAPPASAATTTTVTALPLVEQTSARIVFGFAGTVRRSFSVRFADPLKPEHWTVPGLRAVSLRKEGSDLVADLDLLNPVADELEISVKMEDRALATTGARTVPEVRGVAVKPTAVVHLLSSAALRVKPETSPTVQLTDSALAAAKGIVPVGTFRILEGGKMSYAVTPAEDRSAVKVDEVYQLSAQKAEIIAVAELTTGRTPLQEVRIGVPEGFEVQTITGPRVQGWHRDGAEVRVELDRASTPEAKLAVHVAKALAAPVSAWKLEPLAFAQFKKHTANVLIAVHAADDVKLDFDATRRDVREADPASLKTPLSVALPLAVKRALVVSAPAWSASVTLTRQTPKFAVDAVLLAQATDAGLKLSQQTDVIIEQGMVNAVKVRLPKDLPEARVLGGQVRDARSVIEGEDRVYEVTFQSDVLERSAFSMEMELPIDGAKTLPVLRADGASRIRRFFIADNQSSWEMAVTPSKAEKVVRESLPSLPEGLLRPQYFRAGDGAALKLAFTQLESSAGNAAIVTLAEITSALRSNGERWDTVVYSLSNRSLQFLPIRLPAGAELIDVSVGGQQVRTDVQGSGERRVHLVPLIQMRPGELSQQVKLVYKLKPDRETSRLDDPELVGLSAERTLWDVWLPPARELSRWDGNMEEVNEELRGYEKKREMLSDLARMNRVMASSDVKSYDWQMACDNAGALMSKLKELKPTTAGRSYESYGNSPRQKENAKLRETVQKVQAEVEKEIMQQGALLDQNAAAKTQAKHQSQPGAIILPTAPDAKKKQAQNWNAQKSGQITLGSSNTLYIQGNGSSATTNSLAFNDSVAVSQGALALDSTSKKDVAGTIVLGNAATLNMVGSNIVANNARSNGLGNAYVGDTTVTGGVTLGTGGVQIEGGGSIGLTEREISRRSQRLKEAQSALEKGDKLFNSGDYEGALGEYKTALELTPDAPSTREFRAPILVKYCDATVALARERAKHGRYQDAKALLNDALGLEPSHREALALSKQLADPDHFEPALTPDRAKAVADDARRLAMASSYENLGDQDNAIKEYRAVLKTDPNNQAARRGLERVEQRKSEYFDSARDHQRARMLNQVTEGWEAKVPAPGKPQEPTRLFKGVDEAGTQAVTITPQLKPVGRVSLPVTVPLEGTVHHFRKLKDHAKLELVVGKPLESRQASAMWTFFIGAALLGAVAGLRKWRSRKLAR